MRRSSLEFITSPERNLLKIECTWPGSSRPDEVFTYDHLKSFTYSANGTPASSIQLGLASICSIDFALINTSGKWDDTNFKGAQLTVFLGKALPSGDEYIKMGIFTVEDGVKNEGVVNISASDRMALFDTRFKGVPFPCTIRHLLSAICLQVDMHFVETEVGNFDFIVDSLENVTSLTCREVISLACEMLGGFAIINSEGDLEIRWFNTNRVAYTVPERYIISCKPSDMQTPTGVSGYFDGEEIIVGGTEALINLTSDNILLQNVSFEEKDFLVKSVFDESIAQLSYDSGSIEAKGLCLLEPGDVIQFEFKGRMHKYLVAAFKLSGNLKMSITSTALSHTSSASGGLSLPSGASSNASNMKTVYALSYDDVLLPRESPAEASKELVSVSLTKTEGHVPIAMFTSAFLCQTPDSEDTQVKFTLHAGSALIHEFVQRCHKGVNSASFSWPLTGLPAGATRISVTATPINEKGDPPTISWHSGDTSLIVFGRGFNISSLWNGLLLASDTFNGVQVGNNTHKKVNVTQINSVAHVGTQKPRPGYLSSEIERITLAGFGSSKISVSALTENLTIN